MVLAGLCALAMQKDSAAARNVVWLAAVLALLLVPVFSVILPAWHVLPQWAVVEGTKETPRIRAIQATVAPQAPTMPISPKLPSTTLEPAPTTHSTPQPLPTSQPQLSDSRAAATQTLLTEPNSSRNISWLVPLWAVGSLLLVLRLAASHFMLHRATNRCQTTPDELLAAFKAASEESGLTKSVRLLVDHRRTIPLVWGVFRPCQILPAESRSWDTAQLRSVLRLASA